MKLKSLLKDVLLVLKAAFLIDIVLLIIQTIWFLIAK